VAPTASAAEVTIGQIAEQLGVRIPNRADEEFALRTTFTGTLADTAKIQEFGIKGFGIGARVTVARIAPDRVYIEVDEIDPPQRKTIRLQMSANGTIVKPARV